MFAGLVSTVGPAPTPSESTPRKEYPPTPIKFPQFNPQAEGEVLQQEIPLVTLLQKIHRPADIKPLHFSALGIHVTSDSSPSSLLPDPSFLPPSSEWNVVPQEALLEANESTRKPLSNGNLSPGVQTYRERLKELQISNLAAFRTIRRIPAPTGETPARLGNAYEFYKNLEFFSGYWPDTSLPSAPEVDENLPTHQQTHVRTGTESQLPPDYRQNLLSAFVKLVAYDFGCNVSFPRTEPRLHLTPPDSAPPSYFNSSVTFIYRTPTDRSSARGGVVEGPVAALSSRSTTGFATQAEEQLDLAREVVAVLLTAQQRARENKEERRFGEGKWWACKARWGGGPGGPIGKEGDKIEALAALATAKENQPTDLVTSNSSTPSGERSKDKPSSRASTESRVITESKRQLSSISSPLPSSHHTTHSAQSNSSANSSTNPSSKRPKKGSGQMPAYDLYRKLLPPSPTWDRKARYSAIGSIPHSGYDDIFLVSALNHHVSILRARVPLALLEELDGCQKTGKEKGKVEIWRSKWYDLFLPEERAEALDVVWGMMGYLMRKIEVTAEHPHPLTHSHLPHSHHDTHPTHVSAGGADTDMKENERPGKTAEGQEKGDGEKMDLS